jgi:hypothetical protein
MLLGEPQIQIVHQRGGLEGVVRALPAQLAFGEGTQLSVDQRDDALERLLVSAAPLFEESCDVAGFAHLEPSKS